MNKIRCAVIGVGYLGRFHAQKYKLLPNADLIAVCDVNQDVCRAVAEELNVSACFDYHELFGKVDAISIAATSNQHYEIAKDCLSQGIHVLIEKPVTETLLQAEELIQLAAVHNAQLQVGHMERFNSVSIGARPYIHTPLFIETQRLAPFNPRGTDVNVILDIMIHDIDIILSLIDSPIVSIDAQGAPVVTKDIDIANARITFANHSVANLTASRISFKIERKMRVFQTDSYLSIDYHKKRCSLFKKGSGSLHPGIPDIEGEEIQFEPGDALQEEIKAFLTCIEQNTKPLVTGEDGRYALEVAEKITTLIHNNLIRHYAKS